MGIARRLRAGLITSALLAASATLASPVRAQGGDGFLFREPRVSLAVRAGYVMPGASSQLFSFTEGQLTVDPNDWNGATFGGDLAFRLTPRFDLALALGYSTADIASEFRDWVDLDDLPIEQRTTFRQLPFTVGLKAYLTDRGRSVGRFAWIPSTLNGYVGAAGGWVWWEFEQQGDFVNFETYDISADILRSDGRAPTFHLFGGTEYTLKPNLLLSLEGRYAWAEGDMDENFRQFEPLDLSGFQASVGFALRF